MKLLFYSALILHFFGCASYHDKDQNLRKSDVRSIQKGDGTKSFSKGAVWELFSPDKVVLHYKNVESELSVSLILNKGINNHFLNPGHWELSGFELDGISYKTMNVSKKFILKIHSGIQTYSGSLLAGCPRASKKERIFLKKMKFFDRYPFSSTHGLCELVIGDNREDVQRRLKKEKKIKILNLQSGF